MRSPWPTFIVVAIVLLLIVGALSLAARRNPLRRAWNEARSHQSYRIAGESRVSAPAQEATWIVTGQGHPEGSLDLTMQAADSSQGQRALSLTIDWPLVSARSTSADGTTSTAPQPEIPLPERSLGAMLPTGDPLLLLATGHAPRVGDLEPVAIGAQRLEPPPEAPEMSAADRERMRALLSSRVCRRVDFLIGARAYTTFWQANPTYLPVNANAGGMWKFGGSGTAWLDEHNALPCRITARLSLPRLVDDRPGTGEVDWVYSDWRPERAED
jgi:hypothetical protein